MTESYIEYWGLKEHPFLLAPDSNMMHMAGQYYECLERLKYAVNTNKGGALVVSEDAGLGKTTILLKLINEMKEIYGNSFRYAFVDHPTLTSNQLLAYITGCFTNAIPDEQNRSGNHTIDFVCDQMQTSADIDGSQDKLKNLMALKEALIKVKQQGGKSIIIVDEGQMLCGAHDILQELRILINLTFNNEYLHTFILSGQKPLWNEIKSIPEFWQRLPVRYYLIPLQLNETKELIRYRLKKAGLSEGREIFSDDALEIIQRYSNGSPRTIIAMSDLSLLTGYADRSGKIGFKEMSKVINAMSGSGDSIAYINIRDREMKKESLSDNVMESVERRIASGEKIKTSVTKQNIDIKYATKINNVRPFFAVMAILLAIIAGFAGGYYFTFGGIRLGFSEPMKKEIAISNNNINSVFNEQAEEKLKTESKSDEEPYSVSNKAAPEKYEKEALIIASAANVRIAPCIDAARIGMIFEGEKIKIVEEKSDSTNRKWYKFFLLGDKEGWISEELLLIR